ncbi:MAG: hypothetical protein KBT36_14850 [Kurthia sp.]|nr:hypothetical protein [Candidatus Kurthia equi]
MVKETKFKNPQEKFGVERVKEMEKVFSFYRRYVKNANKIILTEAPSDVLEFDEEVQYINEEFDEFIKSKKFGNLVVNSHNNIHTSSGCRFT